MAPPLVHFKKWGYSRRPASSSLGTLLRPRTPVTSDHPRASVLQLENVLCAIAFEHQLLQNSLVRRIQGVSCLILVGLLAQRDQGALYTYLDRLVRSQLPEHHD